MLSTQYRLRLEFICKKIANKEEVKLDDMIWAEKLAKRHTTARDWLNKARRQDRTVFSSITYLNDDFTDGKTYFVLKILRRAV